MMPTFAGHAVAAAAAEIFSQFGDFLSQLIKLFGREGISFLEHSAVGINFFD